MGGKAGGFNQSMLYPCMRFSNNKKVAKISQPLFLYLQTKSVNYSQLENAHV